MTSPMPYRSREKTAAGPEGDPGWFKKAMILTFAGGVLGAAVVFFIQKKALALGFFSGSLLSIFYFRSLQALTEKILKTGDRGRKVFWFWTALRWGLAGLACWGLVLISPSCLLGALGGYLWALAVLGWQGWRSAAPRRPFSNH